MLNETGRRDVDELWLNAAAVLMVDVGYVELRSALAGARRARRLTAGAFDRAKHELERRWRMIDVIATDLDLVRVAGRLAEARRLRALDAIHLAAALSVEDDELVVSTWDRQLHEATQAVGLAVAPV